MIVSIASGQAATDAGLVARPNSPRKRKANALGPSRRKRDEKITTRGASIKN